MEVHDQDQEYDVILYAKLDGTRISANRDVLSRSSSFFNAMFSSGMIEANEKEVTFNGIPGLMLNEVVNYCYTGDLTVDNMEILAEAAVFFQLNDNILEKSIELLSKNLCVENCIDFILLAERHDLKKFLHKSMEFTDLFFDSLRQQETFYEISMENLKNILKRNTLETRNEQFVFNTIVQWYNRDKLNRKNYLPDLMKLVHLPCLDRSFIASFFLEFCIEHDCFEVMEDASAFLSQNDNELQKRSNCRMSGKILAFDDQNIQVYSEKTKTWSTCAKYSKSDELSFDDCWMEGIKYNFPIYSDRFLRKFQKIKLWNRQTISETQPLLCNPSNRITKAYWLEGDNCKLYVVGYNQSKGSKNRNSAFTNHLLHCFEYDPDSYRQDRDWIPEEDIGLWTSFSEIVKVRDFICIAYIDSYLYVVGAMINCKSLTEKEKETKLCQYRLQHEPIVCRPKNDDELPLCRYSLVKREWQTCPPLNDCFDTGSAVVAKGCIYVIFEKLLDDGCRQICAYYFNPTTDSWKSTAPLNVSVQNMKACGTNKFLYIIGNKRHASIETATKIDFISLDKAFFRYDPDDDKWKNLDSLPSLHGGFQSGYGDFELLNVSNFI